MTKQKLKDSSSVKTSADVKTMADKTADKQNLTEGDSSNIKKSSKPKKSTAEPTTMEELLAVTGYTMQSRQRRDMIEGTILLVTNRQVLIDIGGKSDAVIHEKEIPFIQDLLKDLKAGDKVSVQVVNPENDRGQTVVSLRKSAAQKRWDILTDKMKKGEKIEVTLRELSKGGFLIDYNGLRGFIPLSQIEQELVRLGDKAFNRRVQVKVLEVDRDANRLILSQTGAGAVSEKQLAALKKVELGSTYKAEVTGIAPFGAFVSVKVDDVGIAGLIHISEIAWEKVESPNDYLKVGQTVEVKAIGADQKSGKLTLSLKQLLADPWEDVAKVLSVDQQISGKVTRLTPYGAFVSLLPGIEGLIHISKMAPGEEPKSGEEIECTIEEINPDKRKISLSMVTTAKPIGYR